jgi:hypothetical protein
LNIGEILVNQRRFGEAETLFQEAPRDAGGRIDEGGRSSTSSSHESSSRGFARRSVDAQTEFTRLQKHAFALEASVVLAEARLTRRTPRRLDLLDRAALAAGQDANLIGPRLRAYAQRGRRWATADAETKSHGIIAARARAALRRGVAVGVRADIASNARGRRRRVGRRCSTASARSARRASTKIRWLRPEAEPRVSCDARGVVTRQSLFKHDYPSVRCRVGYVMRWS